MLSISERKNELTVYPNAIDNNTINNLPGNARIGKYLSM